MSRAELSLYLLILFRINKQQKATIALTNKEIERLAGLAPNSVLAGRTALCSRGLVQCERGLGGVYSYTICDPDTHQALVKPGTPVQNEKVEESTDEKTKRRYFGTNIRYWSPEQYERYYRARLKDRTLPASGEDGWITMACPLHADKHPSFSLNLKTGTWKCHAGCGKGGVIQFEMKFSNCSKSRASANIAAVMDGRSIPADDWGEPVAIYLYVDELGTPLFRILRNTRKDFKAERALKRGGWAEGIKGVRRVLYRLPEVIAATRVIICEGEKDADAIHGLGLIGGNGQPVAVTTNPFGAGNWLDEYSSAFRDKDVLILADADEKGMAHADDVRDSIARYAGRIEVATFSEVADVEDADASDFLELYGREKLQEKIKRLMGDDWLQAEPIQSKGDEWTEDSPPISPFPVMATTAMSASEF